MVIYDSIAQGTDINTIRLLESDGTLNLSHCCERICIADSYPIVIAGACIVNETPGSIIKLKVGIRAIEFAFCISRI